MPFNPKFTITPKIHKALVEIERVRGFLDAVKLKDDWVADMQEQQRIVTKLDKAQELVDLYRKITADTSTLMPALLDKAFRGGYDFFSQRVRNMVSRPPKMVAGRRTSTYPEWNPNRTGLYGFAYALHSRSNRASGHIFRHPLWRAWRCRCHKTSSARIHFRRSGY